MGELSQREKHMILTRPSALATSLKERIGVRAGREEDPGVLQERVVGGLNDSELIEVMVGRELRLRSAGRELAIQVESGRGRVSGRFPLASSQHRGSVGAWR